MPVDGDVVDVEPAGRPAASDVPPPELLDVEVGVEVEVEVEVDSLVSALASVAVAEASVAWAVMTSASRSARFSDANVRPAVTLWPTETSTDPTVPETLKFRFA